VLEQALNAIIGTTAATRAALPQEKLATMISFDSQVPGCHSAAVEALSTSIMVIQFTHVNSLS
jgi:hypothetical protein